MLLKMSCHNAKKNTQIRRAPVGWSLTFDLQSDRVIAMPNLQVVGKEDPVRAHAPFGPALTRLIFQWSIGIIVAFGLGTWLVWWAAYSQRQFMLEEIRTACKRLMPETAERCVDTVIIQRGGARR